MSRPFNILGGEQKKLNRASSSFLASTYKYLNGITDTKSFLKYYQNVVLRYMTDIDIDSRGLLISFTMGMGKSIMAVAIAAALLGKYKPMILTAGSLRTNMQNAIRKYAKISGDIPDVEQWITTNFSFVTLNSGNMIDQLHRSMIGDARYTQVLNFKSLNGYLIIVDEAHNLFRAICNGSANALALYDKIMNSSNVRVIFLTGTPIANDPFELVPCFNMLGSRRPNAPIFPESYTEFTKMFVGPQGMINVGKFQNRIQGLVSYMTHTSKAAGADIKFPEKKPIVEVRVKMTNDQYAAYVIAREAEQSELTGRANKGEQLPRNTVRMQKPQSGLSSTYRVRSRKISNMWREESPKFDAIIENIGKFPGYKGLVYSVFVKECGILDFARRLERHGYDKFGEMSNAKKYAIITGDIPIEERQSIQNAFNMVDNKYGESLHLLLISSTGAEGLDLKHVCHVHIMEPYWIYGRIEQVEFRAARIDSHIDLEPHEQVVHSFVYIAVSGGEEQTTDLDIWQRSIELKKINDTFVDAIKAVSIECLVNDEDYCRRCNPDGRPLYSSDIELDVRAPDPCVAPQQKTVKVNEIVYGDSKYYYSGDDDEGYTIYYLDENVGAYRTLAPNDAVFAQISQKLRNREVLEV